MPGPPEQNPMEGGATARRALRILEAVATAEGRATVDDLAAAVGLNKSTAYRLARVLQDEAYLERTEEGYRLGSRMVGLAAVALPQFDVYAAARPVLRRLSVASRETVTLHRRAGDLGILVLAEENDEHMLRFVARIGEATPLVRGSAGLAMLAALPDQEKDALLARGVGAARRGELREQIEQIRRDGWVLSEGANHPGASGIAVAIPSVDTAVQVAVAVSGPSGRWTRDKRRAFAQRLIDARDELGGLFAAAGSVVLR
jgi:DNA-binding IclR family transcriptional regulator